MPAPAAGSGASDVRQAASAPPGGLAPRRARLRADAAAFARLDAASSLRGSALGGALVRAFDAVGIDAALRPFLATGRDFPSVSVRVDGEFVLAAGMLYSAVGAAEGPLRPAQVERDGRVHGSNLRGAVALVARSTTPFRVTVQALAEAGAVAVIVYNNRLGFPYATLTRPSSIPAVTITQEAGAAVSVRADGGNAQARVDVSQPPRSFAGANVVAHHAGASRRRIVVATPADAPPDAPHPGANADGLALLLELARFAAAGTRHAIDFIAVDATHRGYVGSRWYLASLSEADLASIDAVLTFERPGRPRPLRVGASPELRRPLDARLTAVGTDLRVSEGFGIGRGDHDVFAARGIPYVFVTRSGPSAIDVDALLESFQITAAALHVLDDLSASPPA